MFSGFAFVRVLLVVILVPLWPVWRAKAEREKIEQGPDDLVIARTASNFEQPLDNEIDHNDRVTSFSQ